MRGGDNRRSAFPPLTLTLSPQAGRGDVSSDTSMAWENAAAYFLRPACGEKVAGRPDEGRRCAPGEGAVP